MKNFLAIFAAVALGLAMSDFALADPSSCDAQSPTHSVALVELYTSEGCSSCPPADTWLQRFQSPGFAASQNVIPLAFHVDYWDSIGWTDRFSDHRYTERQNYLAATVKSRLVYTPEVFVNGREVRNWTGNGVQRLAEQLGAMPSRAKVVLHQQLSADGSYRVNAKLDQVDAQYGNVALFIALYENNLTSVVKAGENSGATLHHSFATRALSPPAQLIDGRASGSLEGKLPAAQSRGNFGFVAFAEDLDSGEVLQAVAATACATPDTGP